MSYNFKTI
jgi:nucleolar GTP-binding protein